MLSEGSIYIQHRQDVFVVFIDYKKAFDKVRHQDLLKMLEKIQIDDKDLHVIRNPYNEQVAAVRMPDKSTTAWARIGRGVRQGCVMSSDIFNLYSEMILRELEDVDEGIVVNGVRINNIRYADDTVFMSLLLLKVYQGFLMSQLM